MVYRVAKDYPELRVVDLSKTLCDAQKCTLFADGHEIYKDRSHFNKYGSRFVAPLILSK